MKTWKIIEMYDSLKHCMFKYFKFLELLKFLVENYYG